MLYNIKGEVPEGEYLVPIGKADVKRAGQRRHASSATRRRSAWRSRRPSSWPPKASMPRSSTCGRIRPLDHRDDPRLGDARRNRCVVVEEGWPFAGVGAQVVDLIQREIFDELDAPVLRVTGADVPMPYNKHLEKAAKADAGQRSSRRQARAVPASRTWQPRSSWKRSLPRWKRGASSSGRSRKGTPSPSATSSPRWRPTRPSWSWWPAPRERCSSSWCRPGRRCRCRRPWRWIGQPGEVGGRRRRGGGVQRSPAAVRGPAAPAAAAGTADAAVQPSSRAAVALRPAARRPLAGRPPSEPGPRRRQQAAVQPSDRVKASPLARKIAGERGVDLGAIAGSGPEGRDHQTGPGGGEPVSGQR